MKREEGTAKKEDIKKEAPKKEDVKKEAPKKEDVKKEDTKKEEAKTGAKVVPKDTAARPAPAKKPSPTPAKKADGKPSSPAGKKSPPLSLLAGHPAPCSLSTLRVGLGGVGHQGVSG